MTAINVNTEIYDKSIDRSAMIRLYERRVQGKVSLIVDGHAVKIEDLVRKAKMNGPGFIKFREAVDAELARTTHALHTTTKRSLLDLVGDQISYTYQSLDASLGKIWHTSKPTRRIAEDIVLSRPIYSNQTLAQGWNSIAKGEKIRIESLIRKGLAEGLTEEEIALNVRKGSIFKITKNQSQGLVTTAITSVYAQTDHEVYKVNEKALQGWQYVAVLDSRTTPLCAHRDGTVYPISDTSHLPPSHFFCYLEDTEVLTENGFKLIKDTIINEKCLSLDPETEDLTWQPIITKFEKEVEEIIFIKAFSVDIAVTADHPFIGQKRVDRGNYKEYLPKYYNSILDIPPKVDFRMFASSKWIGKSIDKIIVNNFEFPSVSIFCKFMAWWLSDGSVSIKNKGYIDCCISQYTHKQLMLEELKELNPSNRQTGLGFVDQNLNNWLLKFGKCTEKYIPKEIKNLPKSDLLVFLEAYLLGDGTSVKQSDFEGYTSNLVRKFFTTSKQLMADLCELIIKVGDSASVYERLPSFVIKKNGDTIDGNYLVYHIAWNRSQYRRLTDATIIVECDGLYKVYDIELADKHTLLTKRNGKIIWGSNCRSSTIPIVKSYEQLGELEGIAQIRKRNLEGLTDKQIAFYDGQSPLKESYNEWLTRQASEVQLRHLGDIKKLEVFRSGQLTLDKFTNDEGNSIGIKELRKLTDPGYALPGDTRRFALAKEKLDTLKLGAARPDEILESKEFQKALKEYYLLQDGELDGMLSLTNYRGTLLHNKRNTKIRVLSSPPTEDNLKYNPFTGRYDDARIYQPNMQVLENTKRLVEESEVLLPKDKDFILKFVDDLDGHMGTNQRAVITDNLRIIFQRARENKIPWANLKAVLNGQMKFDVMNVSDYIETQIRKDANLLFKLKQENYIDPVLGPVQLQDLHDNFLENIQKRNTWENTTAPKIARELRGVLGRVFIDPKLPLKKNFLSLTDRDLSEFYLKFAHRLSLADMPDRDQFAVSLGRDLYNMANYRGSRKEWFELGVKLLDVADDKGIYKLETYGVQKRRMKSRVGRRYFLNEALYSNVY